MATQGAQANVHGSVLEELVVGTLVKHGFRFVRFSEYRRKPRQYGDELLLKHVPFTTIYGGRGYTEFLLLSEKFGLNTRIECKWQQRKGSVDEKLPYTYLSCVEAAPENDVVILIDGPGFRPGSVDWLRKAAAQKKYYSAEQREKSIRVMNMGEFITWANNTFR